MVLAACGGTTAATTTTEGDAVETTAPEAPTTTGGVTTTAPEAEFPEEPVEVIYYVGGVTSSAPQDWAAVAQGFFEEVNIEIEFVVLDGTSQAVQAVAADGSGFAFTQGSILDEMLIVDANTGAPPLIGIAAGAMFNPVAMIFLEGNGISTPADLVGKTIGVPQGSLSATYLDVFLEAEGIAPEDVEILNIGFAALNPALLTGQVDAIVAFARAIASVDLAAQEQDDTVGSFMFADYDIPSPLTGVVVQKRLMDEYPEVARAIAVASTRGLHFCAVNAEQCIQDFVDLNEGRDFELTLAEWEVALEVQYGIDPEAVQDVDPLTLGWWDGQLIADTIPDLRETFGIATEFDPTTLYTNDYVTEP
jgi:NitT/TauT family transport system substrate-binding protein